MHSLVVFSKRVWQSWLRLCPWKCEEKKSSLSLRPRVWSKAHKRFINQLSRHHLIVSSLNLNVFSNPALKDSRKKGNIFFAFSFVILIDSFKLYTCLLRTFARKMLSINECFVVRVCCLITSLFTLFLSTRFFFSPRIRELAAFRSLLNPVEYCSDIRCLMKRRFSKAFLPPIRAFPVRYMTSVYISRLQAIV